MTPAPRFATYFDQHYAAYGVAMIRSLVRHDPGMRMTVLCLDDTAERIVKDTFGRRVARLCMADLAAFEPRLTSACADRSPWETYATHKPVLMRWLLERLPAGAPAVFVDADLWFFSDPRPLWRDMAQSSVALSPHRFPPSDTVSAKHGVYNAGFVGFRNDEAGRACVRDWGEQCLDWCRAAVLPDGRFMNQGYLSRWPDRHADVRQLTHPGHNLAPWNLATHRLDTNGSVVHVDGRPLVFFHFSGLLTGTTHWKSTALYPGNDDPGVIRRIYGPYLKEVNVISLRLHRRYGIYGVGSVKANNPLMHGIELGVPVPAGLPPIPFYVALWEHVQERLCARACRQ